MPEIAESILKTIKKMLNIHPEETGFDVDIVANINSVFMILHQLGVGPNTVFSIEDETDVWSDFISDISTFSAVKTYIYVKVKMMFDPAATSFVIESLKALALEMEWRLMVQADPPTPEDPEEEEG